MSNRHKLNSRIHYLNNLLSIMYVYFHANINTATHKMYEIK